MITNPLSKIAAGVLLIALLGFSNISSAELLNASGSQAKIATQPQPEKFPLKDSKKSEFSNEAKEEMEVEVVEAPPEHQTQADEVRTHLEFY